MCINIHYAFKFIVQAPYNLMAFSPTNVSVMLEWSVPESLNAMAQGIRIERYELKYVTTFVKPFFIYSYHTASLYQDFLTLLVLIQ